MQSHFGRDPFERSHLEVGGSHPVLDGSKRVFNGFAPLTHLFGMLIEPLLDSLKNVLVLPARRVEGRPFEVFQPFEFRVDEIVEHADGTDDDIGLDQT